jgi:hypothetical protein
MEIPSVDFIHLLTIGPLESNLRPCDSGAAHAPGNKCIKFTDSSTVPHRVPIKPRLAPSLSFIVISIHYSVHYMT